MSKLLGVSVRMVSNLVFDAGVWGVACAGLIVAGGICKAFNMF